jgi:hypothetical protein
MAKPTFQALAQRGPRELLEAIALDVRTRPTGTTSTSTC